ncbi:hypothetical protein NC653_008881 [Populus alba x Populus x berolinensis]|uniref:Uncharacterized protein n=1 Tax=Populus alba x Populus x berolinensis TaxID=444605 RepID=A0AAD6R7I5_9ROSI|nr:hypothetical protein NC653_008881 [Populus alba x Populus x berolinensis]
MQIWGESIPLCGGYCALIRSLVVRLVFLPLKESSHATFSRSASGVDLMLQVFHVCGYLHQPYTGFVFFSVQDSSAFSFTICLPSGFIAAFVESKPEPNE